LKRGKEVINFLLSRASITAKVLYKHEKLSSVLFSISQNPGRINDGFRWTSNATSDSSFLVNQILSVPRIAV